MYLKIIIQYRDNLLELQISRLYDPHLTNVKVSEHESFSLKSKLQMKRSIPNFQEVSRRNSNICQKSRSFQEFPGGLNNFRSFQEFPGEWQPCLNEKIHSYPITKMTIDYEPVVVRK